MREKIKVIGTSCLKNLEMQNKIIIIKISVFLNDVFFSKITNNINKLKEDIMKKTILLPKIILDNL